MQQGFAVAVLLTTTLAALGVAAQSKPAVDKPQASSSAYTPVLEYDPKRDAAKDIASGVREAQRTKKNVLVEIGGKWCVWCGYLDKFFAENTTIRQYRDENFIMVKVNYSPENKNQAVISKYGKVTGYPHIFVLDSYGKLLYSEDTSKLEQGRGYNLNAIAGFLKEWTPTKQQATVKQ
jgi:thioredoxin-related protein